MSELREENQGIERANPQSLWQEASEILQHDPSPILKKEIADFLANKPSEAELAEFLEGIPNFEEFRDQELRYLEKRGMLRKGEVRSEKCETVSHGRLQVRQAAMPRLPSVVYPMGGVWGGRLLGKHRWPLGGLRKGVYKHTPLVVEKNQKGFALITLGPERLEENAAAGPCRMTGPNQSREDIKIMSKSKYQITNFWY